MKRTHRCVPGLRKDRGVTPGSLRGSGATHLYLAAEDVQKVQWRGRWSRLKTVEFYLEEAIASAQPVTSCTWASAHSWAVQCCTSDQTCEWTESKQEGDWGWSAGFILAIFQPCFICPYLAILPPTFTARWYWRYLESRGKVTKVIGNSCPLVVALNNSKWYEIVPVPNWLHNLLQCYVISEASEKWLEGYDWRSWFLSVGCSGQKKWERTFMRNLL